MRVIPLVTVDDTALVSSNVPENDFVLWSGATTYAANARVRTTDHRVFQSVAGSNLNNDPLNPDNVVSSDNPSAPWIYVSKTNRWRAFDGRNSAKTRQAGSITYELLVSRTTEAIALTGLEGQSVRVEVLGPELGPELVTNGTFDTDTDWIKGSGVTITGGKVNCTSTNSILSQTALTIGKTYFASIDYVKTTGVRLRFTTGSDIFNTPDMAASGTLNVTFVATNSTFEIQASGNQYTGTLDNVSIKEVLPPVFDETRQLLDTSTVQTYFQYFTFDNTDYVDAAVFYNISAFAGYKINVTITAVSGGDAAVSIIGYGRRRVLGEMLQGTTPQIADYSTKETNVFGERVIVQRAYARQIEFNLAIPTNDYARVERILIPLRATPAIYYESEALENNLIVSGIYSDFSPPLAYAITFATLTVLGDI